MVATKDKIWLSNDTVHWTAFFWTAIVKNSYMIHCKTCYSWWLLLKKCVYLCISCWISNTFGHFSFGVTLSVLWVAVCRHWGFLESLLHVQTMESLYVLPCAVISKRLSLCKCECVCLNFDKKKKKSYCVTTACLALLCFRGEGKTGRIMGWYDRGTLLWNYICQIKEMTTHRACHCDYHMPMKG